MTRDDSGRKTSVYLSAEQDQQMKALGVSLAEVVRRGLEAIATQGTGHVLVVRLHDNGRYDIHREQGGSS